MVSEHHRDIKMKNKMELRDIKLSSILLRVKANKKALRYGEAYFDAQKLWGLMSPQERINNSHFKENYINELQILVDHFERKNTPNSIKIDKNSYYNSII